MNKNDILELEITDLAFGGRGLAKVDDFVVFVDGALPGQTVKAKLIRVKPRYAEAKSIEVLKRSADEVEIPYVSAPGAPWAQLPMPKQIQYKTQQVRDFLERFAKIDLDSVLDEVSASPEIWNYRNKIEFSFGGPGFALGSKVRGQFAIVESLESPSGLFDEAAESLVPQIRVWCEAQGLEVYNTETNKGFFRYLVMRKSRHQDQILVQLVTTSEGADKFEAPAFKDLLVKALGDRLAGVVWTQDDKVSDTVSKEGSMQILHGQDKLIERLGELDFEISLASFFQTNPAAAELLYKKVVHYANLHSGQKALDLYCGTGTIAQMVGAHTPEAYVVGVEISEAAVADAQANALRNSQTNVRFFSADVRVFLKRYDKEHVSVIIIDPPRAGMNPKALRRVIEVGAQKIVYVSCNPSTFARDVAVMKEKGYVLKRLSIIDQFPHTSHVEVVGELIKPKPKPGVKPK